MVRSWKDSKESRLYIYISLLTIVSDKIEF